MKKYYIVILTLLTSWSIMTFCDYHDEKINTEYGVYALFLVPIVCIVLYTLFRKKIYYHKPPVLREIAYLCGLWLLIGTVFAVTISLLMDEDKWIVEQRGDVFHMLNGVEYPLFGIAITLAPLVYAILLESVLALIRKIKSKN